MLEVITIGRDYLGSVDLLVLIVGNDVNWRMVQIWGCSTDTFKSAISVLDAYFNQIFLDMYWNMLHMSRSTHPKNR